MRRFSLKLALFLALQVAVFTGLVWVGYRPGAVHMRTSRAKHTLLRESPGPRIIFVGGSNLLFGLDSPTVYRDTGYHPVNMGVQGGLRLDYLLNEVEPHVRSGDVVLLALEHPLLYEAFGDGPRGVMAMILS